ncbi:DUF1772 domain-containing protein [Streptosporangium sp. NPDC000396]|uniref:anthrone oxygenase family protein n=1 Tax=Streptosporangium sp. NPDC000396 TaxID=3366185 RepID=UPI003683FD57
MKLLQTLSLIAATLTTGLMAGLFTSFSYAVMPGLSRAGDRAFISVMQHINKAIINGWFMISFMGALVFTVAAAILHWRGGGGPALPWIIAGFVLYLVMFIITSAVNVPLNDQLAAAGNPQHITDLAAVRAQFEARWVFWNVVRAVTSTAAFGCLIWALVLHGRTTG